MTTAAQEIHAIAEAIAPTWEARRAEVEAVAAPVREWMLRKLAARPGDVVLELAAGVGDTGFDAADIVGERGRLISSDFSPAMLAAARRRGAERGIANAEFREIDAEQIELDTDSVDGVLCRFGYMLMPDPARALTETRRVLRPGGRLALAVWGALERNPFFAIVGESMFRHGHLPPEAPPGPPAFSLADAERTAALLEEAGFSEIETEEVPVTFTVPDAEGYLSLVADTSGPLGLALGRLSDTDRATVKSDAEVALAPFAVAQGYALPGVALGAAAAEQGTRR
jgi:ubiquinone/menaquinone biosynthesis C-methylase UbiE